MSMSVFNVLSSVARLSKGLWWGPHAARAWMLTIGAFALALLDVGVQVALNHWTKDFFDAIEKRSVDQLSRAALLFVALIAASTAVVVVGMGDAAAPADLLAAEDHRAAAQSMDH